MTQPSTLVDDTAPAARLDQLGLGPTEYESFLATLATPLPTEFRVLQSHMMHDHALHEVERLGAAVNAELPGTFSRISWYPGSAYRIHVQTQLNSLIRLVQPTDPGGCCPRFAQSERDDWHPVMG